MNQNILKFFNILKEVKYVQAASDTTHLRIDFVYIVLIAFYVILFSVLAITIQSCVQYVFYIVKEKP
ncbi:hypothetical protein CW304_28695 [Bacillus sp. UFRGS-B20]|nr:hypothetical protein CW304_28695 [Bacillus sp. UFRGS-B20]